SGVMSIADQGGAFVRSAAPTPLTTLEATAHFTGLPWEHIGWASLDFAGAYAVVSTYDSTTTLFARTSDGANEQRTSLGALPPGFHRYRIERQPASASTDTVTYYVDGVVRAQHTVNTLPAMYVYQSNSGGSSRTLDVDSIWVYPAYVPSGSYQSCTL